MTVLTRVRMLPSSTGSLPNAEPDRVNDVVEYDR